MRAFDVPHGDRDSDSESEIDKSVNFDQTDTYHDFPVTEDEVREVGRHESEQRTADTAIEAELYLKMLCQKRQNGRV
jgi:hypothetical protein